MSDTPTPAPRARKPKAKPTAAAADAGREPTGATAAERSTEDATTTASTTSPSTTTTATPVETAEPTPAEVPAGPTPADAHAAGTEPGARLSDEPVSADSPRQSAEAPVTPPTTAPPTTAAPTTAAPTTEPSAAAAPTLVEPAEPERADAARDTAVRDAAADDLAAEHAVAAGHPESLQDGERAPLASGTTATPATDHPATAAPAGAAAPQIVYVENPVPPRRKSNRAFGAGLALVSTVVFAALYAALAAVLLGLRLPAENFDGGYRNFLIGAAFIIPIIVYAVVALLMALLVNRAAWWAHVLGSLVIGVLVYVFSVGILLLLSDVVGSTPDEARTLLASALAQPILVAAAIAAREVSMWFGFAAAARGRRVTARNAEARAEFDREQAERAAERDRGYAGA